jgi:hypothetical protein
VYAPGKASGSGSKQVVPVLPEEGRSETCCPRLFIIARSGDVPTVAALINGLQVTETGEHCKSMASYFCDCMIARVMPGAVAWSIQCEHTGVAQEPLHGPLPWF